MENVKNATEVYQESASMEVNNVSRDIQMVVVDENGMHARELSVDEVDDILDKWLSKLK